jgi:urease accessory protein
VFRTLTDENGGDIAASGPEPWRARLDLQFGPRGGKTWLVGRSHVGPLQVQRAFHPEPGGCCHVYVIHPPGGLAGGDELTLRAAVEASGAALLTTPAATKFYRARRGFAGARQSQRFEVAQGACLEWLPQETIVFDGAHAALATEVRLARGAAFLGWETVGLGRPASRETFRQGGLSQRFDVWRESEPLLLDRLSLVPGDPLHAAWGLQGASAYGTFVCVPPSSRELAQKMTSEGALGALRDLLPRERRLPWLTATCLSGALVLRYLGGSLAEARALFARAWEIVRPLFLGRPAAPPRIWAT